MIQKGNQRTKANQFDQYDSMANFYMKAFDLVDIQATLVEAIIGMPTS